MEVLLGSSGLSLVSVRKSACGYEDWRCWCTELRLEDSLRMLQNEIEKRVECATLLAAVESVSV